jgi:hypothetical protein
MSPAALPQLWRERAALFRSHGARAQAMTLQLLATELEEALAQEQEQLLSRAEAVEQFEIHPDTLTRYVRDGELPNRGRQHAPRYRRGDLLALGLRPRPASPKAGPRPTPISSLDSFTRRALTRGGRG